MLYDVFICHASEDKEELVRPLALELQKNHIEVWYDEFSLVVGDSLREAIDRGLAKSRFGIVVLSPSFFSKRWAQRELNGLVAREISEDRRLVLPIWHNINREQILAYSPPLADVLAIPSDEGIQSLVRKLNLRLKPVASPLIVARDFLIEKGLNPPVVTDEWWLDIIEIKENTLKYPDLNHDWRWIFPLPFGHNETGRERGLNIGWTALQMDWAEEGMQQKICQLTRPEKVHEYLKRWPGLWECVCENARVLALYAPQLTIKEFSLGLDDLFDKLIRDNDGQTYSFSYGTHDTVDGNEPLCGDIVALRHPTFGNLTDEELSRSFVSAHDATYSRQCYSFIEVFAWLLSNDSEWLPQKIKSALTNGIAGDYHNWNGRNLNGFDTWILNSIYRNKSKPKITRQMKVEISEMLESAIRNVGLDISTSELAKRFWDYGVVDKLFDAKTAFTEKHRK